MELGVSLPHSQESTTCPYPSGIISIPLPITVWTGAACSLPGRAKDLSAPRYCLLWAAAAMGYRDNFCSAFFNMLWDPWVQKKYEGLLSCSCFVPISFGQAQIVSFLVGLRTYQHPGIVCCERLQLWDIVTGFVHRFCKCFETPGCRKIWRSLVLFVFCSYILYRILHIPLWTIVCTFNSLMQLTIDAGPIGRAV